MLKYCNDGKSDLELDKFYSYKKSTGKECLNKKVKCDCNKDFNSTNLFEHIKQIHATNFNKNSSQKNNSTSNSSEKNDNTSISSQKNISTYNENDHKAMIHFNETKKKSHF